MALLPRNRSEIDAADISIKSDVKQTYVDKKKFTSKERKPIQLDPPVLKTISALAYVKGVPMYELVDIAVNAYIDKLNEQERALFDTKK